MGSIFDLSNEALATLFSESNGLDRTFWNIGLYYKDFDWLNRSKTMFKESLKMKQNLKTAEQ